jgi:hypothetical protein
MEIVFNELSCLTRSADYTGCYKRVELFGQTYKEAERHGFKVIRCCKTMDRLFLMDKYSLADFCNQPSTSHTKELISIILGRFRKCFIDDESEEKRRYRQNCFFVLRDGIKYPVHGLAAAYLYQTIGIGFSEDSSENLSFPMEIEGEEKGTVDVISVYKPEHFVDPIFVAWKERSTEVQLQTCDTPPDKKSISLTDDHGKDILDAFARRLVLSPYVKAINSLPYHSNANKFIRKIKDTGLIEIVLIKTDQGLSLAVQTTGRNLRETKDIADILEKEFG